MVQSLIPVNFELNYSIFIELKNIFTPMNSNRQPQSTSMLVVYTPYT